MRNEYEDEAFFQQYAQMPRSQVDLGCGYGWHCKFAAEQGARQVLGIDMSQKMIEEARRRNSGTGIRYQVCGIGEYTYPEAAWDCVVSNLALHYIEDLDTVFENIHRTLKEDGIFVLEHGKDNHFEDDPHFMEHRHYGSVNFTLFRATATADEPPTL